MAPRRSSGGGSSGSSGGGSSSACPYAFKDGGYTYYATPVVYFVNYCLIFALTLGILISLFCIKKRHGNAKKLLGPFYLASLLCQLIGYVLLIIGVLLRECGTTPYYSYYDWAIVYTIFFRISNYLLLVVVVWGVNSLLRERLGSGQGMVKIGSMVVLGFMGALTCGYIGLSCYNIWTVTPAGMDADADNRSDDESKLAVAYYVFYLVTVLAAGGSAVATTFSMRSRRLPVGDIFGWVIALFFCMFIWVLFTLIELGSYVSDNYFTGDGVYEAFAYIESLFEIFAWIVLLFLAKSRAWDHIMVDDSNQDVYVPSAYPEVVQNAPVPHPQQQYAYSGQGGQQYYYQQQPVYNGTSSPMNGNAHEMHVK